MRYDVSEGAAGAVCYSILPPAADLMTALTDASGLILQASGALAARLGTSAEGLVGRRLDEIRRDASDEGPCRLATPRGDIEALAATCRLPDGRRLTVFIEDPGRAALLERAERAERSNGAKRLMLAVLGHEIRTPLNAIQGSAQLLAESGLDPIARARVANILAAADTLNARMVTLTDFATGDDGAIRLDRREVSLREEVARAVDLFRGVAAAKRLDLSATVADDAPRRLLLDPVRLVQVLCNLLANAVKFTETGEVCLTVGPIGDTLRFQVSDTGCGMEEERLARLWEPSPGRVRPEGRGLGLSICLAIAEAMGAALSAESKPGEGSTFRFDLPLDRTRA